MANTSKKAYFRMYFYEKAVKVKGSTSPQDGICAYTLEGNEGDDATTLLRACCNARAWRGKEGRALNTTVGAALYGTIQGKNPHDYIPGTFYGLEEITAEDFREMPRAVFRACEQPHSDDPDATILVTFGKWRNASGLKVMDAYTQEAGNGTANIFEGYLPDEGDDADDE